MHSALIKTHHHQHLFLMMEQHAAEQMMDKIITVEAEIYLEKSTSIYMCSVNELIERFKNMRIKDIENIKRSNLFNELSISKAYK